MKLKNILLPILLWASLLFVIATTTGCADTKNAGASATNSHAAIVQSADAIDQKVTSTDTKLNSAGSKVQAAASTSGVPASVKNTLIGPNGAQSDITSAKTTVDDISKTDTPSIRKNTGIAQAGVAALQNFYNKWNHAWFGPRLWAWIHGLIWTLIGFGILVALIDVLADFSPFAFLIPIVAGVRSLLGPIFTEVFTVGIPTLVSSFRTVGSYLVTKVKSLWTYFRTKKATTNTSPLPVPAITTK